MICQPNRFGRREIHRKTKPVTSPNTPRMLPTCSPSHFPTSSIRLMLLKGADSFGATAASVISHIVLNMTTHTSSDLASMAARLPELAAARSLRLFDAMYMNVPEVSMDSESMSIDQAIEVAALTGSPFVSLDMDIFDSAEMLAQVRANTTEDSPPAENLNRLVGSAAKHNGDNERLWLRWAANGLSYEWSATADWRGKLAVDMARTDFEGQQESTLRKNVRKSDIDALVTLLVADPEVRAAQPTKRHPVGFAVIANTTAETDKDVVRQALSQANLQVGRRAMELEISLKPHLDELAEEFRKTREWKAATSIPKRLAAADAFLIAKAEGHRLSGNITHPLIDAAKQLDESKAIKITFTPKK
jgi:hypothetical protein